MNSLTSLRVFARRFFVALGLSFVISAAGIGGGFWIFNDTVDSAEKVPGLELDEREKGEPANFLIIGSDTREFVDDPTDAARFGEVGDASGQRSDTIMIAHVDPDSKSGFLVSIPRDLWVDIPEVGGSKINAAFNYGPQRVVDTIQSNFDIEINHYLEVNFDGFRNLVGAIGEVPIYFPTPARDIQTGLLVEEAGCRDLNGEEALAYVRSREYQSLVDGEWQTDGTADLGRIRRQQYFIRSLADEAVRVSVRNPLKIENILDKAIGNLRVDPDLGSGDLRGLINAFRDVDPAVLDMVTLPTEREFIGGQDAQTLLEAEAAPIFARLRSFDGDGEQEQAPPDVAPADVRVAVRNGSGVGGQARAALDALAELGFDTVEPPGNADRNDYEVTEVRYASDALAEAQTVLANLGGAGQLVETNQPPDDADVIVVLGRDFESVSPVGNAPDTTAAPTETAPESTTTTTGLPANPGGEGAFPVAGC